MSTAAPPANPSPSTGGYSIGRAIGKCSVCARDIPPGEKFTAAVVESAAGLQRVDIAAECWPAYDKSNLLAYWQMALSTTAPAKAKVFVDDSVLCELFERLAESSPGDEPAKLSFRFVLGLILMRKRLLTYESTHIEGGGEGGKEFWNVRLKGSTQPISLLNPRLDEEQVAQVTSQLGQILSGEPA